MPNWKKVITSGSTAVLNEITSSGGIYSAEDIQSKESILGRDTYLERLVTLGSEPSLDSTADTSIDFLTRNSISGLIQRHSLGSNAFNSTAFTTCTGTTTPSNTQTFTNKSGNISQWTNDSGFTTCTGTINTTGTVNSCEFPRFSDADTVVALTATEMRAALNIADGATNVTNNNQLTNGCGYITDGNTNWNNSYGFTTCTGTITGTGANNQVTTWNGTTSLDGSSNFTYDGTTLNLSYTGTGDLLRLTSTDAGAASAPDLTFCRDSASPADDDTLGTIQFYGEVSGTSVCKNYASIYGRIACATNGQTKGNLSFKAECNNVFVDTANFSPNGLYVIPPDDFAITSPGIGLTVTGGVSGSTTLQIGSGHTNTGTLSSIAGGTSNSVLGACSFIGGGNLNSVSSPRSFIGSGYSNCITTSSDGNVIVGGCDNCISANSNGYHSIGGGIGNYISIGNTSCNAATIAGGSSNTILADCGFIGGGRLNTITAGKHATIAGGTSNSVVGTNGFIGGGVSNYTCGGNDVVVGGLNNTNKGCQGFIGGGCNNVIADGNSNSIVGGNWNCILGSIFTQNCVGNFIGGGQFNCTCYGSHITVVGGCCNRVIAAFCSYLGGGSSNEVNGGCNSTLVGGELNCTSNSCYSFIGGGLANCICNQSACSVIVGGYNNSITTNACRSGILGGNSNTLTHANTFIIGSNLTSTSTCYTFMNNACVAGTTRTTTLIETSAKRFKECILPLQDQIENIKKLEPVEFQWKKDKTKDIGFIAEDVKEIYPDLVAYEEDGEISGVQYSKLTTVLVKALQQQQEQIQELKKELFIIKQNK